jgi:copper(I)-binding protein
LDKELKAGDKVDLTLTFANAGSVTISAEVRNP